MEVCTQNPVLKGSASNSATRLPDPLPEDAPLVSLDLLPEPIIIRLRSIDGLRIHWLAARLRGTKLYPIRPQLSRLSITIPGMLHPWKQRRHDLWSRLYPRAVQLFQRPYLEIVWRDYRILAVLYCLDRDWI